MGASGPPGDCHDPSAGFPWNEPLLSRTLCQGRDQGEESEASEWRAAGSMQGGAGHPGPGICPGCWTRAGEARGEPCNCSLI